MRTLLKASTATPRAQEVANDEHTGVNAADPTLTALTSGWDAFEVWRTRVRAPQRILQRRKLRDSD